MDIKIDQNTVIVFDLDDTLYHEIDYLKSAYLEIARKLEPENWLNLYSVLFSLYRNKQNTFDFICQNYKISKDELMKRYREHQPNITPFAGVEESVQNIKKKNAKVAILTDGRSITQRNKIKALGLISLIDYIVISEELGTEKPNKNNYLAIESTFKLKQYYYIGDNVKKDFITPKKLGWITIGLLDQGLNIHSNAFSHTEKEYLPDHFVTDFKELNFL